MAQENSPRGCSKRTVRAKEGVLNRNVLVKPAVILFTRPRNWNAWILVGMLAIVITIIALIELHLRRLTIHSPFTRAAGLIVEGHTWLGALCGF